MMVFFFSSRRRHTRSLRDWSSDVCSSDLLGLRAGHDLLDADALVARLRAEQGEQILDRGGGGAVADQMRSEERRVGKECRSRWVPDHEKKKADQRGREPSADRLTNRRT